MLRDMEDDRARLQQDQMALFRSRDLSERMQREMRMLLHRPERNEPYLIRLAHLLKRPAHPHIARQSLAAIGELSRAVMVKVIVKLRQAKIGGGETSLSEWAKALRSTDAGRRH